MIRLRAVQFNLYGPNQLSFGKFYILEWKRIFITDIYSYLTNIHFVIDNKIIEQVNLFNYLGNEIYYEGELGVDNKLNNFLKITVILNKVFRPQKTLKKAIKLYNTH